MLESTPVLPPRAESAWARVVVGICTTGTPRLKIAAAKPADVADGPAAQGQHHRVAAEIRFFHRLDDRDRGVDGLGDLARGLDGEIGSGSSAEQGVQMARGDQVLIGDDEPVVFAEGGLDLAPHRGENARADGNCVLRLGRTGDFDLQFRHNPISLRNRQPGPAPGAERRVTSRLRMGEGDCMTSTNSQTHHSNRSGSKMQCLWRRRSVGPGGLPRF